MARTSVETERREQILLSACEQIAERGVLGLRVADVARRAGVSPGIVHYYFDSKLELIRAAFEDNFNRSLARRAVIFANTTDPAGQVLAELVRSYSPVEPETVQAWHVWVELWAAALQDDELKATHDRAYSRWVDMVEEVIVRGQRKGQLIDVDSSGLAHHLVGLIDGLSVQTLLGSRGMTVERMRSICETFLTSIMVSSRQQDPTA